MSNDRAATRPTKRVGSRKRARTPSVPRRRPRPADERGARSDGNSSGEDRASSPPSPPPAKRARASSLPFPKPSDHDSPSLRELHDVFRRHPDLEQKYLRLMRLPITGKETLSLPFDFRGHRQHTCLDLSPYSNDQISRGACTVCARGDMPPPPTASDSMVAFIQQTSNVMRHRRYYYGFRKNAELLTLSATQPEVFQIYYILQACVPDLIPIALFGEPELLGYARAREALHLHVYFEHRTVHIPAACIQQILAVSDGAMRVVLNITPRGHLLLTVTRISTRPHQVHVDPVLLRSKVEELDIPSEVAEKHERFEPSTSPLPPESPTSSACSSSSNSSTSRSDSSPRHPAYRSRAPSPTPSAGEHDTNNRREVRLGMV